MTTRRDFLTASMCATAAVCATGCVTTKAAEVDPNLSVLVSDLHIGGANPRLDYAHARLTRVVDEILALNPRPKRVICFGDIALSFGLAVDYAASKPILQRLTDSGIELHLTMGNHDRRATFLKYWPEYAHNQLVPNRFTRVISLGTADLVLLDTLKGADTRADDDMGPVDGAIDAEQLAWFDRFVAQAKRPFFVGSHQFRDLYCDGIKPVSRAGKSAHFVGWLYGHDHAWCPDYTIASWREHRIAPTLTLPSTGLWGDIGYVVFRTDATGATAALVQHDFYFQTPTAHQVRPASWDVRLQENQGKTTRFAF